MVLEAAVLDSLIPFLRCPRTGGNLSRVDGGLVSSEGRHQYRLIDGTPDLLHPPARYTIDLPWYEPWSDLEKIALEKPEPLPLPASELPYHLDAHLASVPGAEGNGRIVLEIGCGERQCEPYFTGRNFRYIGTDVDCRGRGPHVLADAHNLPFKDACVDIYISMAVYEHLIAPIVAAKEAFRVLKPGGIFCGTSAFVYGFHDRASFHHMTHAGLLCVLRTVGFEEIRMWPDWFYHQSIPEMAFGGPRYGWPWVKTAQLLLKTMDASFTGASNLARTLVGKKKLNTFARSVETAGSISFSARKSPFSKP